MDEQNMVQTHNGVLFSPYKKDSPVTWNSMDETWGQYASKWYRSVI